ncbi:MAG: DUF342 domain-containing protein [Synergistaceae bacterium]|nr:DUF342 domain-containing protein [Synergistaceae bacterium]MBR0254006.1 DUF342 domain-containing protein [Synergistaceae bacterium]
MFDREIFALEARPDGIYLSCFDKNFKENDVYAYLKEYGIVRYDFKAIRKFIKDGETCKVCNRNPAFEKDAKILVTLAKDKMSASVTIEPPFFAKPWPTREEIIKSLNANNVKVGINTMSIDSLLARKLANEPVIVAEGVMPIEGRDARIELIKDPDKPFEVDDDEKIDFWSRSTIVTVHPGQEIAVKIPLENGKNGIDVTGSPAKAKPVRNVEFSFGDGLKRDEENRLLLVATAEGQLKNEKGRLLVLPELDIHKDIDFGVGSIDFTGAVKIHGSVREGFHVVAQGNIEIFGPVEGADIDSQGVVIVHGGIRGMGKGTVRANGDISLNFADNASIRAGGSILAKNSILHSHLYAQRAVIALGSGKHSQIAGGRIDAGLEVSCHVLGSEMGTKTEVVVGLPPEMLEKRKVFTTEIKRCQENLERVEPNIALLKKVESMGQLDDKKRVMLMNLTKMKFQLQAALESMQKELEDLEEQLELVKDKGIVRVKDVCYGGVVITVRGLTHIVHEPCRFTSFIADDEQRCIKLVPFDYMKGRLGG